jgi:hypothetical protein
LSAAVVTTPDWGMRGEYVATRSARRRGDTDIDPAWADEAYIDEARVVFDPDYSSKTAAVSAPSAIPRPRGSSSR